MAKIMAALPALGSISSAIGSIGSIASAIGAVQGLSGAKGGKKQEAPAQPAAPSPFTPTKPASMARPDSLNGLAGYDPTQERSALATKGMNGGLGKDENSYYKNLVSRSLISDDNKVNEDPNSLLPIESQYFSKQGMDTSNINNLLKAIMGG